MNDARIFAYGTPCDKYFFLAVIGWGYQSGKVVVRMIGVYMRRGRHMVRQWVADPKWQGRARQGAYVLAGFCLSAASLDHGWLPLVMGFVWACQGWEAVLAALGGIVGYALFWQQLAGQGILLTLLALTGALLLAQRQVCREVPLLIPAIGMLMVSGMGLAFQILAGDNTPIPLYLLRVALGGATPWLFIQASAKGNPMVRWLCWGVFALGLAQMVPFRWLGLGYVAAGMAASAAPFP